MKMPAVIEHSGPKKLLKHNATRTSMASPTKASVIPHSGHKAEMPSQSNMNIGNPYSVASDRTEQKFTNKPQVIAHSPIGVPKAPKRWNRSKMPMGVPTTLDE